MKNINSRLDCMNSVLGSLRTKNRSLDETFQFVAGTGDYSAADLAKPHNSAKPTRYKSALHYNLAWGQTSLKKLGFATNVSRGVWGLTAKGRSISEVTAIQASRAWQKKSKKAAPTPATTAHPEREARKRAGDIYKVQGWVVTYASTANEAGTPDLTLTGIFSGTTKVKYREVKAPGDGLKQHQWDRIIELRAKGFDAWVCDDNAVDWKTI